ncbi:ribonucleoside-diphosphate reductase subunit alpha [Acinetobacter brisouii]|uniref:ribonucleoside-diphosphate reductase subunit alpha n=1 Tax=Acinetobacter brisouii TaxID=396323 RepID=UPI00124BE2CB|nr:ribonucleoside-diphosphate reductase subunit alpha [Acinetobacter brisouii]
MEISVTKRNGSTQPLDVAKIKKAIQWATNGLSIDSKEVEENAIMLIRPNMPTSEIQQSLILAAAGLLEKGVAYMDASFVAARLKLLDLYKSVNLTLGTSHDSMEYPTLREYVKRGINENILSTDLLAFDLEKLNAEIKPENDLLFTYLGLSTLADRYLVRSTLNNQIIELPQHFLMRVAMGLALGEGANATDRAVEFYNLFSAHDYLASTPTLFNSATNHPQLSSCYLNTVKDQLSSEDGENRYASIYGTLDECARLSKYAGGLGTDWTRVRSSGDIIRGTQGKSSGVVPYLKVSNDTAVAVNQGGKRKGSFAPYLENWHPDFPAFCDLRKNSGDDRYRAHDIFPAGWISDLFMERVEAGGMWSFFSPNKYPDLHELYGEAFKQRFEELEKQGLYVSQMPAMELWKKMLTSLFETGHPWVTFKDTCNLRSPQSHVGVVHSSNLCTEITLNTSDEETAVCNLGSINLSRHVKDGQLDKEKLAKTIKTAVRMLDNVIDINFYPSSRAKTSNLKHRPIGLGVMGYHEYLVKRGIAFESDAHLVAADELFEYISYHAIKASCELAKERGAYETFNGSKWSQGILPIDTANANAGVWHTYECDWDGLRADVQQWGMRNSNVMAIAPTATISNILGTTPCIEPPFELQCIKSNLSGPFTWIDPTLRYGDMSLCKPAHEIDQTWIIRAAAVRQKWIDQSQSLNLFAKLGTKGRDLAAWYMLAWKLGLKTTYYLRGQSNSTTPNKKINLPVAPTSPAIGGGDVMDADVNMCSIDNPDCESCQ